MINPLDKTFPISIIVPTRPGWSQGFRRFLNSIFSKAKDPNNVQVVVKIDHDDPDTFDVYKEYRSHFNIVSIIMDGSMKYRGIPDYTNTLAWNSSGRILWWLSDEIRIETQDWDQILIKHTENWVDKNASFYVTLDGKPRCAYYPIVTRKLVSTIGRFTGHIAIDSYMDIVTGPLRQNRLAGEGLIPIDIHHDSAAGQIVAPKGVTKAEAIVQNVLVQKDEAMRKQHPFWMDMNEPEVKEIFHGTAKALLEDSK